MKQVLDRIRGSNLSMVRFTRVNTRTHTRTEEERRERDDSLSLRVLWQHGDDGKWAKSGGWS